MPVTAPVPSAAPASEAARIRPDAAASPSAHAPAGPSAHAPAGPSAPEPVDLVSLSPLATRYLALLPPSESLRQLGDLLHDARQIEQVVRTPSPAAMGELAAEIGIAADALATQLPRPAEAPSGSDDRPDGQQPGPSHREPHGHVPSGRDAPDHDAGHHPDSIDGRERRLRDDAATLLGDATETLARMQRHLQGAPSGQLDAATRISASAARVARARQCLHDGPPLPPPPSPPSGWRWARLLPAAAGMLGMVVALAWTLSWASRLDLHVARVVAGAVVGLCAAGWAWRRLPRRRRVRVEFRR